MKLIMGRLTALFGGAAWGIYAMNSNPNNIVYGLILAGVGGAAIGLISALIFGSGEE